MARSIPEKRIADTFSPSSPSRPPKVCLYFAVDGEFHSAIPIYSIAAAASYIEALSDDYKWVNDTTIKLVRKDDQIVTIRADNLEQILDSPKRDPLPATVNLYPSFNKRPALSELPPPKTKTKLPPPPSGSTSIQQLAQELNLKPNKARQILRKNKISKPYAWTEPELSRIKALLK